LTPWDGKLGQRVRRVDRREKKWGFDLRVSEQLLIMA
jgi:hypothetical protein